MKPLGEPQEIIIHHSASPLKTTVADINRWHVEEKGWNDVGYHFIVTKDGRIHAGRLLQYQGAHCFPNRGRIGICAVGNNMVKRSRWNFNQIAAMEDLIACLLVVFPSIKLVRGHRRRGGATECPGCDIEWDGLLTVRGLTR